MSFDRDRARIAGLSESRRKVQGGSGGARLSPVSSVCESFRSASKRKGVSVKPCSNRRRPPLSALSAGSCVLNASLNSGGTAVKIAPSMGAVFVFYAVSSIGSKGDPMGI